MNVPIGDALRVPSSKCRTCRAPIFFAQTVKMRLMPVDIAPTVDGNLVIVDVTPPSVALFDRRNADHTGRARFQAHSCLIPARKKREA